MKSAEKNIELEDLIRAAKEGPEITQEELIAQRESWVRSEMAIGLDAAEAATRKALLEGDLSDTDPSP